MIIELFCLDLPELHKLSLTACASFKYCHANLPLIVLLELFVLSGRNELVYADHAVAVGIDFGEDVLPHTVSLLLTVGRVIFRITCVEYFIQLLK